MKVIGEKLKASREESGLSLEEVADDLKVTVTDIKNIEEGNQDAFEDIYFLKKLIYDYAKYLGLNYENLIEEFNEFMYTYTSRIPVAAIEKISKEKEKEEEKKPALSPYTKNPKNNKRKLIILVAGIVLVIALVCTIVIVNNNENNSNNTALAALI
ncbi:MAG TPA: helix-turn-helix domain-containing protein [Bacilli bacterium]|nr:helix-turn-helix domain-containing protein [Bacilli bacterium]